MFPLSLDLTVLQVMLVGNGEKTLRRLGLLEECGASHVRVFADKPEEALVQKAGERLVKRLPQAADIATAHVLMVVDIEEVQAIKLAELARAQRVLVNVEDKKPYCDFHFPSFIKRGDLLLSVSSGGKSPTLSRMVKAELARMFDESWAEKLEELAVKRKEWQAEGLSYNQVMEQSESWILSQGWLKK